MSKDLRARLGLSDYDKEGAGKTIGALKGIADFFSEAVEAVKDNDAVEAIAKSVPWWAEATGTALAEALPPVKFVLKLFKELTKEDDPQILGLLASTLAYQRSVEETLRWAGVPKEAKKVSADLKRELAALAPAEDINFKDFSFTYALQHDFVRNSDLIFKRYLDGVGYNESQARQIQNRVHRRFVSNLKAILSNGKLKERFEPFTQLMELGTGEEASYNAILSHIEYQRWQFEEAPLFGKEPFALAHVYIDTECGVLRWQEICDGSQGAEYSTTRPLRERVEPFSEKSGGRRDLLGVVREFMADPKFRDAIVIQGAAGSGKSSFTLKLCAELEREGLYPIRIRLRDLSLDRHITESLPKALFPPDYDLPGKSRGRTHDDPFRNGAIFKETTNFGGAEICSYVLILDGWDEISISASEGFKVRVGRVLEQLRAEYLQRAGPAIRVILTGRPSAALSESYFLREETPVLTIRPVRPDQLEKFTNDLREAVAQRPVTIENGKDIQWSVPEPEAFTKVLARYSEEFNAEQSGENKSKAASAKTMTGSLAVLGLPLLAHLAVRMISLWKGDRAALVENPTTLYRCMVDLTCGKGGKAADEKGHTEGFARVMGTKLRQLLQRTAAAMTIYGTESISYTELSLRLDLPDQQLNDVATDLSGRHDLTALMISFFFKGGHTQLGCEFLHKSFREYFFAEGIVEALKEFGRQNQAKLAKREPYWMDFDERSPQRIFSRTLSEMLAPQWLSPEVIVHIEKLLAWEIERAAKPDTAQPQTGDLAVTLPITMDQWKYARDGLADVWDWWAEGVHMRPQPATDKRTRHVSLEHAYAEDLVNYDAPFDPSERSKELAPARTTTMDAHLGDGLFRLCAIVHYRLAVETGWLQSRGLGPTRSIPYEIWEGVTEIDKGPRRCQSAVIQGTKSWVLFAPSGADPRYFAHYAARINAAAWRTFGPFPRGVDASGADFRGSKFAASATADDDGSDNRHSIWRHANLQGTFAAFCFFFADDLTEVFAPKAMLLGALLTEATFEGAYIKGGEFQLAIGDKLSFKNANLSEVLFSSSFMFNADFSNADVNQAEVAEAVLKDVIGLNIEVCKGKPREITYKKVE
jgi:hypothetical protein